MDSTQTAINENTKIKQTCPFCGMTHPMFVRGLVSLSKRDNIIAIVPDRGYSFCNCKNIFFTNWENMDQELYNDDYNAMYHIPRIKKQVEETGAKYIPFFKDTQSKKFVEIGCSHDRILDLAKEQGWETTGVDIYASKSTHNFIVGNIEKVELPQADVYWAGHVIEHLKEPLKALKNIYDKINPGGYLFVAMPDPWFIPWGSPHGWSHWHVREHYILWDMDSFIDELIEIGFKLVLSYRNVDAEHLVTGDYHIIMRKV